MNVEISREGEGARVQPRGDIVATSVPELRPAMRDLVRDGVRQITVDLADTIMIDSTGLGFLISAFNSVSKVDGSFSVINASPEILELLDTMRMSQHFSVSGRQGRA